VSNYPPDVTGNEDHIMGNALWEKVWEEVTVEDFDETHGETDCQCKAKRDKPETWDDCPCMQELVEKRYDALLEEGAW